MAPQQETRGEREEEEEAYRAASNSPSSSSSREREEEEAYRAAFDHFDWSRGGTIPTSVSPLPSPGCRTSSAP